MAVSFSTICSKCDYEYESLEVGFYKCNNPRGFNYHCKKCSHKSSNISQKRKRDTAIILEIRRTKNRLRQIEYRSRISDEKAQSISDGIANLRYKYTWSESGHGWMNSKERESINHYKINLENNEQREQRNLRIERANKNR